MTLRQALAGVDGLRFLSPSDREERVTSTGYEATSVEAQLVGDAEFRIIDVPALDRSGFTHFLDGAQRSWQVLYRRLSPVYLAHTSAALLERIGVDLQPPTDETFQGSLEAYVADDPVLRDSLRPLMDVVPVDVKDASPGALDELISQKISERRDLLEKELAQRFSEGKLLIDGGLGNALRIQGEQPFVVGVVKSHRKQYFRSPKRTEMLLGLRIGQRSSVFVRPADAQQGESVYSFYLRLHEAEQVGPLFGIVRVEMPADDSFAAAADEIAGWILHERAPLSLPDPRFDKLLYPIRLVEQHLKARQPSTAAIVGMIG